MLFINRPISFFICFCLFSIQTLNMSFACVAGCGRHFQRESSMICHLSSARSCQWYLSEKFRAWDEEEDDTITFPPMDEDYGGVFDKDDDHSTTDISNLHSVISQLNLGPQDTVFIPHITADLGTDNEDGVTVDEGPAPDTAANQLRRAALSNHTL